MRIIHSFPTSLSRGAVCAVCAIMRPSFVALAAARASGNAMTTLNDPADSAHNASSPFGALLRRYRTLAGLSQESLAGRAGVSVRAVSDLERGVNRTPRAETLDLLVTALGLGPADR